MQDTIKVNENTWRFEDGGVRFFLLEGKNEALLIDTGMTAPNAKELALSVTSLPVRLLNTHADPDHISGNSAFDEVIMSKAEGEFFRGINGNCKVTTVTDGDIIDLGERELLIIDLPGHTTGSIAVLDLASGVLIGGDSVQDGRIFMFGERRDMNMYIKSLTGLWNNFGDRINVVYPSHGSFPVEPSLIPQLIEAAKSIADKTANGQKTSFMGQDITYYDFGFAGFLCEAQ